MKTYSSNQSTGETIWRWFWVVIFAAGFAWVESAVVVYLREIFYEGSDIFPLPVNWQNSEYVGNYLTRIELIREFAFGVWDIFYYVWLKVMIAWPESLLTWDILFLLPLPWVGPVITPVLIALAMTAAGTLIIYLEEKGYKIRFYWYDWMIVAFCWDWKNIIQLPGDPNRTGIPNPFSWGLYLPPYLISVFYFIFRLNNSIRKVEQ